MISIAGVSKTQKLALGKVASFFMKELRISRASVYIRFVDIPAGNANFDFDEKKYFIEISKHSEKEEMTRSIAHELVHVHQVHTGRLKRRGLTEIFDGVETSTLEVRYQNLPSEMDAYQREEELYQKCLITMSISGN